jgi:hypothetical protein
MQACPARSEERRESLRPPKIDGWLRPWVWYRTKVLRTGDGAGSLNRVRRLQLQAAISLGIAAAIAVQGLSHSLSDNIYGL